MRRRLTKDEGGNWRRERDRERVGEGWESSLLRCATSAHRSPRPPRQRSIESTPSDAASPILMQSATDHADTRRALETAPATLQRARSRAKPRQGRRPIGLTRVQSIEVVVRRHPQCVLLHWSQCSSCPVTKSITADAGWDYGYG